LSPHAYLSDGLKRKDFPASDETERRLWSHLPALDRGMWLQDADEETLHAGRSDRTSRLIAATVSARFVNGGAAPATARSPTKTRRFTIRRCRSSSCSMRQPGTEGMRPRNTRLMVSEVIFGASQATRDVRRGSSPIILQNCPEHYSGKFSEHLDISSTAQLVEFTASRVEQAARLFVSGLSVSRNPEK
jgi:hypothetical protein